MIIFAFVLCMMIGLLFMRLLSGRENPSCVTWTDIFLSWGLGVGCASQIAFYTTMIAGQTKPVLVKGVGFLILGVLLMGWVFLRRNTNERLRRPNLFRFVGAVLLLCYGALLCWEAVHLPFGGYDGWSLWNYRAVSVFRGGEHWMAIFHNDIQGKHPWLLPFFVLWGWSFAGGETVAIPIVSAVLMSVATVGLLMGALAEEIGWIKAIFASVFLVSIPFFSWHAISQYADIFVGFYLLASCYCLKKIAVAKEPKYIMLSAIFLGLLVSAKDEGIMLAGLCLIGFVLFVNRRQIFCPRFFVVFGLSSLAMVISEIFMRGKFLPYPVVKSLYYYTNAQEIFSIARVVRIWDFIWNNIILYAAFGRLRLWAPFLLLGFLSRYGRFLLMIILGSLAVYFMYYMVVATEMIWRIDVTIDRLLFQLNPIMVFLLFYGLFGGSDEISRVKRLDKGTKDFFSGTGECV